MTAEELFKRIKSIRTWQGNGSRAPHKILLLLIALGRLANYDERMIAYSDIKDKMKEMIQEYAPAQKKPRPCYPFVRLVNDGFWEIKGDIEIDSKKDYSDGFLLDHHFKAGFTTEAYDVLKDKVTFWRILDYLLENNFAESMQQDLLNEVGLSKNIHMVRTRDPEFRNRILTAYQYKCAVCGFDVQLGTIPVGIEAAHIKWHQAGGPDKEENGIALCVMHHKLFDRGVFTIDTQHRFLVSERARGTKGLDEWLLQYHDRKIFVPNRPIYQPNSEFKEWHFREVFKEPSFYAN